MQKTFKNEIPLGMAMISEYQNDFYGCLKDNAYKNAFSLLFNVLIEVENGRMLIGKNTAGEK